MLFSSPLFLFVFLPLTLAGYWLTGSRGRNLFLLATSLFFYAWGEPQLILVMVASLIVNYFFGLLIVRTRRLTGAGLVTFTAICFNLGLLAWYKYTPFMARCLDPLLAALKLPLAIPQSQHIPLGISFLTFQAIAYLVDVSREDVPHQPTFCRFALFMTFFPKLIAGPILRYRDLADQLGGKVLSAGLFAAGAKRFVAGLGKKVLIADSLAKTADHIFAIQAHELSAGVAWLGIAAYSLQLYFDFSGYTDMAIGLGRLFGFELPENFNYPYCARSLTDFWRRWHISLSSWLRDYLFTPLSFALVTKRIRQRIAAGNYRTNYRSLLAIVVVFTLCGLWHGADWNFLVWGALHGLVLSLEALWLNRILKKLWRPLQHAYLLLTVMLTWVFFRLHSFGGALSYLKALAGLSGRTGHSYPLSLYFDNVLLLALFAGVLGSTPFCRRLVRDWTAGNKGYLVPFFEIAGLLLTLAATFASLANSTYYPFIYQQF